MKRAAFGIHMHSGWGVLVAVCAVPNSVEVLARRRIITANPEVPGAIQPYHFAALLQPPQQERHLADCAAASSRLAAAAIADMLRELETRNYRTIGAAVLMASGRPLPALAKILAAHPLIHTAEGEFFRNTVSQACETLQVPVTAIRERDLDERAVAAFGKSANRLQTNIAALGGGIGPPWTKDHKTATLAAALVLAA
jgi:hypothetical protein